MSISGEHRLAACCRRELADGSLLRTTISVIERSKSKAAEKDRLAACAPRKQNARLIFRLYETPSDATLFS